MTLNTYLDEESSPWWGYVIGFPNMIIGGVKSLFVENKEDLIVSDRVNQGTIELSKRSYKRLKS